MPKDVRPLFSDEFLDDLASEISILCGEPIEGLELSSLAEPQEESSPS